MVNDLVWLWRTSRPVAEVAGMRGLQRRLVFMFRAVRGLGLLRSFIDARPGSALQQAVAQRPEIVGAIVWPYQCVNWNAPLRLHRIEQHFEIIDTLGPGACFPVQQQLQLLDLADVAPQLRVVLDQPRWFLREGQLVINLFLSDVRVFSLAFSFAAEAGKVVACAGAIQGGNTEGLLDEYKALTKALHGMRPRDLLVELFRMFCFSIGISKILAVADASRQYRSSYYGSADSATFSLDYDEIWRERGGVACGPDFFELSVEPQPRRLEDVPSKKRAMYRRRYELLQALNGRMRAALLELQLVAFDREALGSEDIPSYECVVEH